MYLSLLIFCACGTIAYAGGSGDSDDEEKFIDLLPEEEKNAFIESVARRLIPGVKTRDSRYKSDEEVSDEELNQHSEYVRKVLQEESNSLRRNGNIKTDSDEKLKVRGLDRESKPIHIQNNDVKNHIDLTLRGHRRKRNEKEFGNEEIIIPVKTEYDDENERSMKTGSNTKVEKDDNQHVPVKTEYDDENEKSMKTGSNTKVEKDENQHVPVKTEYDDENERSIKTGSNTKVEAVKTVNDDENERSIKTGLNTKDEKDSNQLVHTKSKERADEDSINEDIQVRGSRPHSKGLRLAKTIRPILRDATIITDFEPEESNEYVTPPNETHEDTSTNNVESETHEVHKVTISKDDVESSHKGFTQSIFESHESGNEGNSHSNESAETTIYSTTAATEITVKVTTDNATTTTLNIVTETVGNKSQNTTEKRQYLRANFINVDKENITEINLDAQKKGKNSSSENADTKAATNLSETSKTDIVMEDSIVEVNNANLRTENKSDISNEQDYSIKNKSNDGNEEDSLNKSVKKDVIVFNIDYKKTTEASPSSRELESKHEVTQKDDEGKDIANSTENSKKNIENAEESDKAIKIKDMNSTISDIKHSAEDRTSKESNGYVATTENNKLYDDKIYYVTKEVNSSYALNNVNNLRSDIKNKTVNINATEMVPTVSNKTQSDDLKVKNLTDTTHKQFQGFLEKTDKVLTTTEKSSRNMSKNNTVIPNHQIYYSSYVQDNVKFVSSGLNSKINFNNDGEDKSNVKKGDKLEYENQSAILEKITKTLRQGFSEEEDENELEEMKPKLFQSSGKIKEYLVYEIPADQTPFVPTKPKRKKKHEPKEQPYYVPIYNYSPNNAYYNAYNRLGPNEEDDNEILENVYERNEYSGQSFGPESMETFNINNLGQPDGHRIFKYISKKRNKYNEKLRVVHNSNSIGLPLMIKKPKVTEIYFNPDEYLDMDYYFERSRNSDTGSWTKTKQHRYSKKKALKTGEIRFPDSDEQLHPYNSMAEHNIKNHMSAVRHMLFQHKLFGFVPDEETTPTPGSKNGTNNEVNHNDQKHHNDHKHHNDPTHHNHHIVTDHNHHYDHNKYDTNIETYRASERLSNLSDYIVLLPNGKQKKDYPNQHDISVDYYFGIYNTDNNPEGKRYEDFIRASKHREPIDTNKAKVYKQNMTLLTDLIGETKRRLKAAKNKNITEWKKNAGTFKEILEMSDANDVFPTLEKLREFDLTLMRRKDEDKAIEVYVNVLTDMIKMDNRGLNKFDWLGSTVDLLGAVAKLKFMTEPQNLEELHPSDIQLLKYVLFLYKSSKSSLEESTKEEPIDEEPMLRAPRKKHNALPRNKNRKKQYLTTGLLNRVWLYIRDRNVTQNGMNRKNQDFLQFLDDLKNSLFDLHYALKHIAMVTKFKNQQWFPNLKSLYLKKAKKKEILELLLHIFTSRLLDLLEESAVNGVEDGVEEYVKHNEKQVKRTKEEFVFVLKLLDEIKNNHN